jgi:Ca2+-transporting ATPase
MNRGPRRATDRAIDGPMWRTILSVGLVTAIVSLFALDIVLPGGLVAGAGSVEQARTATFTTLVFAQLFNALNARSAEESAFRRLASNRMLWAAIALGAVLQVAVVQVPVLQVAFSTAPLSLGRWSACVGLASVVLWYEEGRKALARALRRRHTAPSAT